MKTLDLVIVADKWCPTSRTYLTYLHNAGLRVKKIILVDFVGRTGRWPRLRGTVLRPLAEYILKRSRPAWPDFSQDVKEYCRLVQVGTECVIDYSIPFDYDIYADHVISIVAADYDDRRLQKLLLKSHVKNFLYTNGGRVPEALLLNNDVKFFHIHPGVVPHVRGSDGLYWSIAVRGRPGVSCFYMDAGIDTGDLIATKEFDLPDFKIDLPVSDVEEDALYRDLLLAYDPHLRASLFRDVMVRYVGYDLGHIPTIPQAGYGKDNYLWMHKKLRLRVISEVLKNGR